MLIASGMVFFGLLLVPIALTSSPKRGSEGRKLPACSGVPLRTLGSFLASDAKRKPTSFICFGISTQFLLLGTSENGIMQALLDGGMTVLLQT